MKGLKDTYLKYDWLENADTTFYPKKVKFSIFCQSVFRKIYVCHPIEYENVLPLGKANFIFERVRYSIEGTPQSRNVIP